VTALDATTGKPVMKDEQMYASNKQEVLEVAGKLADRVRKGLGDTTSTSQSAAETYSAASLQAAHEYAVAQNLQQAANGRKPSRLTGTRRNSIRKWAVLMPGWPRCMRIWPKAAGREKLPIGDGRTSTA